MYAVNVKTTVTSMTIPYGLHPYVELDLNVCL